MKSAVAARPPDRKGACETPLPSLFHVGSTEPGEGRPCRGTAGGRGQRTCRGSASLCRPLGGVACLGAALVRAGGGPEDPALGWVWSDSVRPALVSVCKAEPAAPNSAAFPTCRRAGVKWRVRGVTCCFKEHLCPRPFEDV